MADEDTRLSDFVRTDDDVPAAEDHGATGDDGGTAAEHATGADHKESTDEPRATDEDSEEADPPAVEPAEPAATWAPGATCDACGDVVERRWRDGGALVCAACKDW